MGDVEGEMVPLAVHKAALADAWDDGYGAGQDDARGATDDPGGVTPNPFSET